MASKLVYTDPKKKKLQQFEFLLLAILLPLGLFYGGKTFDEWQRFKKAEALYKEASALCHAGDYEQGIPKLQAALEAYPPYYAVWEELGVSYHMRGEHEKELETYKAATAALPENGNLHRELATAYHELGQHEEELEAAKLAINLPNSDELFTGHILDRAQKEANGEVPTEVQRPHTHLPQEAEAETNHQHEEQAKSESSELTEAETPENPPVD